MTISERMMILAEKVKLRDYALAHELQELARELINSESR